MCYECMCYLIGIVVGIGIIIACVWLLIVAYFEEKKMIEEEKKMMEEEI